MVMMMYRYPVEREKYSKIIGDLRVRNIAEILKNDFGFMVNINAVETNRLDLVAWFKGTTFAEKPYLAAEIINWKYDYELTDINRKDSMIRNLTQYEYKRRWLITSFRRNIGSFISEFETYDIEIKEIGFQTQPTHSNDINFYDFFKARNEANDKRPWNEETRKILRQRIESWLNE